MNIEEVRRQRDLLFITLQGLIAASSNVVDVKELVKAVNVYQQLREDVLHENPINRTWTDRIIGWLR